MEIKLFMSTLQAQPVQIVLNRLHAQARVMDQPVLEQFERMPEAERTALFNDYKKLYGLAREAFLPVSETFGRMLYLLVRSSRARTVVEFGTSFGISTLYLAAGLRDNGGGKLITCELEPGKSHRAKAHLSEAGLADLVEFRIGDGLELLKDGVDGTVDLLLLDGAKPLYWRILKLIEPSLKPGSLVASDNINERNNVSEFTNYIRNPKNGYVSVEMPLEDGIELSLRL